MTGSADIKVLGFNPAERELLAGAISQSIKPHANQENGRWVVNKSVLDTDADTQRSVASLICIYEKLCSP